MTKQTEKTARRLVDSKQPAFDPESSSARNPYEFDLDKNGFPLFTDKNIRFVKGIIRNDSSYNYATDGVIRNLYTEAAKGDKVALAKTVWFTDKINSTHLSVVFTEKTKGQEKLPEYRLVFDEHINFEKQKLDKEFKDAAKERLDKIKSNNEFKHLGMKEHLDEKQFLDAMLSIGSDKLDLSGGRYLTFKFIWDKYRKNGIANNLLSSEDVDHEKELDTRAKLVFEIATATENEANKLLRPEYRISRTNFSFASKFCHHACIQLSDHKEDNFCIYDGVLAAILPYYAVVYADDIALSNWIKIASKETKTNSTGTKFGRINRILTKLKDVKSYRGYRLYLDFYSLVKSGINEWRKDPRRDLEPLGFDDIDSLLWHYFKGFRKDLAAKTLDIIGEKYTLKP